jgi:hypothetical protein
VVIGATNKARELATIDLAPVEQIKEDWTETPFTSFTIRSENQGCLSDEYHAFKYQYEGVVEGCKTGGKI